jgi:hypothetical protein
MKKKKEIKYIKNKVKLFIFLIFMEIWEKKKFKLNKIIPFF